MSSPIAILAILIGAGASVVMLLLLLAGMPNSSPAQLARIKALMLGVLAIAIGAVIALRRGWLGYAAAVGVAPAAACLLLFIVLMWRGG